MCRLISWPLHMPQAHPLLPGNKIDDKYNYFIALNKTNYSLSS
ncbi:hypothetical protein CRENPOLYSF1_390030 [Crenothrix polyspora]|uniref:Uncharacterized protein n=1 Tax=Crenothrix polyspora TaxID=360316 RepID=A0A1R4HB94_9GAMM|nr:hypothetical protein CRENPOLYSF1_390030 [Crenothrix polyspora]